jgi:hypothetical protein
MLWIVYLIMLYKIELLKLKSIYLLTLRYKLEDYKLFILLALDIKSLIKHTSVIYRINNKLIYIEA